MAWWWDAQIKTKCMCVCVFVDGRWGSAGQCRDPESKVWFLSPWPSLRFINTERERGTPLRILSHTAVQMDLCVSVRVCGLIFWQARASSTLLNPHPPPLFIRSSSTVSPTAPLSPLLTPHSVFGRLVNSFEPKQIESKQALQPRCSHILSPAQTLIPVFKVAFSFSSAARLKYLTAAWQETCRYLLYQLLCSGCETQLSWFNHVKSTFYLILIQVGPVRAHSTIKHRCNQKDKNTFSKRLLFSSLLYCYYILNIYFLFSRWKHSYFADQGLLGWKRG